MLEHLKVFSGLRDIIENSTLINQVVEMKGRKKYNFWNCYFNHLIIDGDIYKLEFEVVSMDNGENHYRVQRLKKIDASHGDVNNKVKILPFNETSISDNNIT